jgi:TolB-like protein
MHLSINLAHEPDFGILDIHVRPAVCHVEANQIVTRVEPKVMEVLVLLARAQGATVSRDQLIEACWEGRIVSEDAITRTLRKARKIGSLTNPPAFHIETRPKVGVRLIARDQAARPDGYKHAQHQSVSEPLLIVFPFENLSTDSDLQFFVDGVSEEVLGRIIGGSKLRAIGPASSFQYRGPSKAGAARALKATHIVDGTVRRSGQRVRINAHLTEVATGAGLWVDQFERDLGDIFALQDEIADGIAQALFTTFTPADRRPIDPAVYDLYLRAKGLETNPDRLLSSITSLELVTQHAPDFADGWGRLAVLRAFMRLNMPYAARAKITMQTHDDIARCYQSSPDNAQANYANYWLTAPFGDFINQERIVQQCLKRDNPASDDLSLASFHYYNVGRRRVCNNLATRGRQFDPSSWAVSINYAISLWSRGEGSATMAALRAHIEAFPEDQQAAAYQLLVASYLGDWEEIDRLTSPVRLAQFPLRENGGILATVATMRYPTPENRRFLFEMMKTRAEKIGGFDCVVMTFSSMIGMASEAYDSIAQLPFGPTNSKGDALGMMGYRTHLLFTPANERGRADPRFVHLCARLGLVDYWLTTELWPDCINEVPYDFCAECEAAKKVVQDAFAF